MFGRAPVAEAPAALFLAADETAGASRVEIIKIPKNLRQITAESLFVAVYFIHLIRHDRYRAAPACGASAAAHERRGVLDVTASDALAVGDIFEPLFIEFLRIQKHHRRFTAELTVACVAESLYMRAVRGHARMHVAQLRSDICVVEPVEHLAVRLER